MRDFYREKLFKLGTLIRRMRITLAGHKCPNLVLNPLFRTLSFPSEMYNQRMKQDKGLLCSTPFVLNPVSHLECQEYTSKEEL